MAADDAYLVGWVVGNPQHFFPIKTDILTSTKIYSIFAVFCHFRNVSYNLGNELMMNQKYEKNVEVECHISRWRTKDGKNTDSCNQSGKNCSV